MPVEQIRVSQKWLNKHAILMSFCSYEAKDAYPHALAYGVQQGEIGFRAPKQLPFEVRNLDSLAEGQYFMPLKKKQLYYPLSQEIPVDDTDDVVDVYRYTDENDSSNSLLFLTKEGPGLFARKYSTDSWSCSLFPVIKIRKPHQYKGLSKLIVLKNRCFICWLQRKCCQYSIRKQSTVPLNMRSLVFTGRCQTVKLMRSFSRQAWTGMSFVSINNLPYQSWPSVFLKQ